MNFDLLSIGEMVIDFTPGSEKDSYIRNPGGAPANVAIAMSRLGKSTAFCGMVGDDDFGWFLIHTLESDNVEVVCRNPTREAFTTMAFMSVNESGDRSFTFARKPGADMLLRIEDVDLAFINSSTIVNAGSCSLSKGTSSDATEFAMKTAHEKNKLVSFDVNYRDLLWDSKVNDAITRIRRVLPSVDFLHVSEEEVFILGGEEKLPDVMRENNITIAVLTLGERGAKCFYDKKVYCVDGRPAKVVDTCGAGDAFWGGFLTCLLNEGVKGISDLSGKIIEKALKTGNTAGWLAVQNPGAIPALPKKEELEACL